MIIIRARVSAENVNTDGFSSTILLAAPEGNAAATAAATDAAFGHLAAGKQWPFLSRASTYSPSDRLSAKENLLASWSINLLLPLPVAGTIDK
ncbi:MAG: hypothetical protein QWI73_05820 [Alphaproteobacteria bacterium]|nr:hypothetical protein [Alphaproteobacteria bacterium]